jgi:hypothetical protein
MNMCYRSLKHKCVGQALNKNDLNGILWNKNIKNCVAQKFKYAKR